MAPRSAIFPDYGARIAEPMDLRTVAEKLSRGVYRFGGGGDAEAAAARCHADVLRVFANCRAYNPPRATVELLAGASLAGELPCGGRPVALRSARSARQW